MYQVYLGEVEGVGARPLPTPLYSGFDMKRLVESREGGGRGGEGRKEAKAVTDIYSDN